MDTEWRTLPSDINNTPLDPPFDEDSARSSYDSTCSSPERISLVYSMLPYFVRRRIRPLPSLRGVFGRYVNSTYELRYNLPATRNSDGRHDSLSSASKYMPSSPLLRSRPASSCGSSTLIDMGETSSCRSFYDGYSSSLPDESKSGVIWSFAHEGCTLLNRSARQASLPSSHPLLTRRLYFDALSYLLRGLPQNMTEAEMMQLQQVVPSSHQKLIEQPATLSPNGSLPADDHTAFYGSQAKRNTTYAVSSKLTLALAFLFDLLLPYIQMLASHIYRLERKSMITERAVANGLHVGGSVWKQSVAMLEEAGRGIQDGLKQKAASSTRAGSKRS